MNILLPIGVLIVVLTVPVILGIYVFRDARARGMNAVLWTIAALFVPSLLGFIMYLIVRANYPNLRCPRCDTRVTNRYVVCPQCGAKLHPSCPNCASPVETDWKVCPKCANPLPETWDDIAMPVKPKDRALPKIILAVTLIPILCLGVLVMNFSAGSSSTSSVVMSSMEYAQSSNQQIRDLYSATMGNADPNKAYIWQYTSGSGDQIQVQYAVFYPLAGSDPDFRVIRTSGAFGDKLLLTLQTSDSVSNDLAFFVQTTGGNIPAFDFRHNGRNVECVFTQVDFELMPNG